MRMLIAHMYTCMAIQFELRGVFKSGYTYGLPGRRDVFPRYAILFTFHKGFLSRQTTGFKIGSSKIADETVDHHQAAHPPLVHGLLRCCLSVCWG